MNGSPSVLAVLIVDDNQEWARHVRLRIERSLPESQRVVRWESSLAGATAALKEFHADITILDLTLPDSPDPMLTAKSIPKFRPPVFVMSNHFLDENPFNDALSLECFRAGAERVYPKDEVTIAWVVREIVQTHVGRVLCPRTTSHHASH